MDSASVFSRLKEGPKGLAALQTCSKVQSYALWPSGGHLALRGLRANRFLGSRLRTKRMETYYYSWHGPEVKYLVSLFMMFRQLLFHNLPHCSYSFWQNAQMLLTHFNSIQAEPPSSFHSTRTRLLSPQPQPWPTPAHRVLFSSPLWSALCSSEKGRERRSLCKMYRSIKLLCSPPATNMELQVNYTQVN